MLRGWSAGEMSHVLSHSHPAPGSLNISGLAAHGQAASVVFRNDPLLPHCQLRWEYFYPRLDVSRPAGTKEIKFTGFEFHNVAKMKPLKQSMRDDEVREQEQILRVLSAPAFAPQSQADESRPAGNPQGAAELTTPAEATAQPSEAIADAGLCSSQPMDVQEHKKLQQVRQAEFFAQMERVDGATFDVDVNIEHLPGVATPPTPPACYGIEASDAESEFIRAQHDNYKQSAKEAAVRARALHGACFHIDDSPHKKEKQSVEPK